MGAIIIFLVSVIFSSAFGFDEFSTRATSLGGAYTAISDDWEGLGFNPAGLADINHYSFGFNYRLLFLGIDDDDFQTNAFGVVYPFKRCDLPKKAVFTAGVGFISKRSELLSRFGIVPAFSLGYGCCEKKTLKLGARGRIEKWNYTTAYWENYSDPLFNKEIGFRYAFDLGFIAENGIFRFGSFIENFVAPDFSVEKSGAGSLSRNYCTGFALNFGSILVSVDGSYEGNIKRFRPHFGLESMIFDQATLRFGLNGKEFFAFGVGLKIKNAFFNYAGMLPWKDSPVNTATHNASLGVKLKRTDSPDLKPILDSVIVYRSCGSYLPDSITPLVGLVRVRNCDYQGEVPLRFDFADGTSELLNLKDYNRNQGGFPFSLILRDFRSTFVVVDPENIVRESNENNNRVQVPVKVVDVCRNIYVSAYAKPNCGESLFVKDRAIQVEITVGVSGVGFPAGFLKLAFYINEKTKIPFAIDSIFISPEIAEKIARTKREEFHYTTKLDLPSEIGDTLFIKVDPYNQITEENEKDNLYKLVVSFAKPLFVEVVKKEAVLIPFRYFEEPFIPIVYFDPGSYEIINDTVHNAYVLDIVRERLKRMPHITVELRGYYDPFMDSPNFNTNEFLERFTGTSKKEELYRSKLDSLIGSYVKKSGAYLNSLAMKRAEAVRRYICADDEDLLRRITISDKHIFWLGVNQYLEPEPSTWFENRRVEIRASDEAFYNPIVRETPLGFERQGFIELRVSGGSGSYLITSKIFDDNGVIRIIKSQNTRIFWDGRDSLGRFVKPGNYKLELTVLDGCFQTTSYDSIYVGYTSETRILRLYRFNTNKPEFYSPSIKDLKNRLRQVVFEADRENARVFIEGYSSYLKLFGKTKNCELSFSRAEELAKTLMLDGVEIRGCGDDYSGACETSCSGSWKDMMFDQEKLPASSARARSSILVIERGK